MPTSLDRSRVRKHLENTELEALFIEELGWDHGGNDTEILVDECSFALEAITQKRGMVAYQYDGQSNTRFPDHLTRQKIEKKLSREIREHLVIYVNNETSTQYWQWVKREPGQPDRSRMHIYSTAKGGESLIQKLEHLVVTLDDEANITIVDVSGRVRAAFDVERVTKKFYDNFKREHSSFVKQIQGILVQADREWYASLMLNRMMFIYFIQKRGFLDDDPNYLRNRLAFVRREHGKNHFQSFYQLFLLRLFHEGLNQPEVDRSPELVKLLGKVPYLNGGLFETHDLEHENPKIHIPDDAFRQIFDLFDRYQWHLDDRPLRNDTEINPDVLGYIFEKYINQKQMGAYYTKEDITGYISRNTVIPHLFDQAEKECPIAFESGGGVWRLLSEDPDRYIHRSVRHGVTYNIHDDRELSSRLELPKDIAEGLGDVSQRDRWNEFAGTEYALPTETWREHVVRRQHYEEVRAKLLAGEVTSINDLVTYNLNIEKFAQDVIMGSEGPELIRAFWKAINSAAILDPTCGSGAFLFATLNILEPLYIACLDTMQGFLDDLERDGRRLGPKAMKDFRKVLERVSEHVNERYFILKSIIVDNLYGVDIMEEAVEICKLRLFLKLVAQLDGYDQIEPLPDIDFNIRTGNTLVGFASLEEVKRAIGSDFVKQLALPDIEERAGLADQAFRKFRDMQIDTRVDAGAFAQAKLFLRDRFGDLRDELDSYLAEEQGVKINSPLKYSEWHDDSQPFHWFVEFYGIMRKGGFDVIVGNPPYVETSKINGIYSLSGHDLRATGNLFAVCVERFLKLLRLNQRYGVIVPISAVSTPRMLPLMRFVVKNSDVHISNFAVRPAKLFVGVDMNLSILVGSTNSDVDSANVFTTKYHRWTEDSRIHLFDTICYTNSRFYEEYCAISKFGSSIEHGILLKLQKHESLAQLRLKNGMKPIFYHSGGRYFRKCLRKKLSSEYKELHVQCGFEDSVLCLLSSSLYYWLWIIFSDCYHVTRIDVDMVPVPNSLREDDSLSTLANLLLEDLEKNADVRLRVRKDGTQQREVNYRVGKSKSIIDQVDFILASHYGLNEREVQYLVNFDAKHRYQGSKRLDRQ